ncbi:Gar1/Naf1 RNA binding region-domain-containing protein [Podospora conica]|nr:Gar1/Naf1 RNA binding region-domain-containing protein [Schizothecium conicum]
MADNAQPIPGLGQAVPNETLPTQSFAPDSLLTASVTAPTGPVSGHDAASTSTDEQAARQLVEETSLMESTQPAELPRWGETAPSAESAATPQLAETAQPRETPQSLETPQPAMVANVAETTSQTTAGEGPTSDPDQAEDKMDVDTSPALAQQPADAAPVDKVEEAAAAPACEHIQPPSQPQDAMDAPASQEAPAGQNAPTIQAEGDMVEMTDAVDAEGGGGPAEWEEDSSPYESSSESDSSDDSDDSDEEISDLPSGGIAGLAREMMMMEEEDESAGKEFSMPVRSKNEIPEDVLPKPDVTIRPDTKIERLGDIEFIVEKTAVINSCWKDAERVIDRGSVLCKEDRTVIGALTDVLGNVRDPRYIVRFNSDDEIKDLGLQVGSPIFFSVEHVEHAFLQHIKKFKGADTSNFYDEEAGEDDMEFSDDEKEAEFKRMRKMKRQEDRVSRHGGQPDQESGRVGRGYPQDDEDGPYKPLSRPSAFAHGVGDGGSSLPPKPVTTQAHMRAIAEHGPEQFHPRPNHDRRDGHRGGRGHFQERHDQRSRHGNDNRFGGGHDGNNAPPRNDFPPAHPPSVPGPSSNWAQPQAPAPAWPSAPAFNSGPQYGQYPQQPPQPAQNPGQQQPPPPALNLNQAAQAYQQYWAQHGQ